MSISQSDTTNMADTFSKLGFLYSRRRPWLTVPLVTALTENKWLIHQAKPIPTSGSMPGSCFEFCYNNERFYVWVTISEPDCIHFNSSSTSPLGNSCQSMMSHACLGRINSSKDLCTYIPIWPTTSHLLMFYQHSSGFVRENRMITQDHSFTETLLSETWL